jgi:hypothetical protein
MRRECSSSADHDLLDDVFDLPAFLSDDRDTVGQLSPRLIDGPEPKSTRQWITPSGALLGHYVGAS